MSIKANFNPLEGTNKHSKKVKLVFTFTKEFESKIKAKNLVSLLSEFLKEYGYSKKTYRTDYIELKKEEKSE